MDAGETLPGAFSAATFVETLFSVALAPMTRTSAVMLGLRRQRLCGHDGLGRGWRPRIPHWRQRLLRELARRRFGRHRCCGGASHRSERITPHLDARIFVRVRVPIANAVAERVERLERGTGHGFDVEGHLCPLNPNSPRSVFIFATFPGGCFSGDAAGMAVGLCSLRPPWRRSCALRRWTCGRLSPPASRVPSRWLRDWHLELGTIYQGRRTSMPEVSHAPWC